jgi:non-ribosomal peptide synthase protein (TIGR01720 family)
LLWQQLQAITGTRFFNAYGPTESTIDVALCPLHDGSDRPTIGRPIANTQMYILDSSLHPVPIGVVGELHIAGEGLARGYLHRPDLTAEKFIPNPYSAEAGARMYKSGDLARYLVNGEIEYVGRIDSQVKIRGFRIELGEIEAALTGLAGVSEAVVVARGRDASDKKLIAYVVTPEAALDVGMLRSGLLQSLPDYMVPAHIVILERMPLTSSGKIDRKALPEPDLGQLAAHHVAPRNATEAALAAIWAEVLDIEQAGIHDDFFHLGGDSILSIQIIARARQEGLYLTPKDLFQNPTVAALATVVQHSSTVQAEQREITGSAVLTPIQHWFFEQNFSAAHHYNQSLLFQVLQPLDSQFLEQAARALLQQHDALRLNFSQQDRRWQQHFSKFDPQVEILNTFDLTDLDAPRYAEELDRHANNIQKSFNLCTGVLIRLAYFKHGTLGDRLLLVCHHLVVDGISWRILLEDLHTAYGQLAQGKSIALPPKTSSLKQWTSHLQSYANSSRLLAERAYWQLNESIAKPELPVDFPDEINATAFTATANIQLSIEDTASLLTDVPVAYNTQINDILLTALAFAFREWAHHDAMTIHLEGHGREDLFADLDVSRTVGWFTSLFPVHLNFGHARDYGIALKAIKEQLRAIPHNGIGYGILRYLSEDGESNIAPSSRDPAISFNYLGQLDQALDKSTLFCTSTDSHGEQHGAENLRTHEIDIDGMITGGQLLLSFRYSANRFKTTTIEAFAAHYRHHLCSIIQYCAATPEGAGGYSPSDFDLADLDQESLDALLGDLNASPN